MGDAKVALEDYTGAILDYTQAIALEPNYAEAYIGRAEIKTVARRLSRSWGRFGDL